MAIEVGSDLRVRHCKPCEGGTAALAGTTLADYFKMIEGWELIEDKKIAKTFKFSNFRKALEFTNRVGELAESQNHHPDIYLAWGKVKVELSTHAVKGLSENDFILAAKIDELPR